MVQRIERKITADGMAVWREEGDPGVGLESLNFWKGWREGGIFGSVGYGGYHEQIGVIVLQLLLPLEVLTIYFSSSDPRKFAVAAWDIPKSPVHSEP